MSKGNWGGSAAGSGIDFQAAVTALCMVHMARGMPLGWCELGSDVPLSVSAETGGAGDDIALQLPDGNLLEIQAKQRLRADSELWDSLVALSQYAHENAKFFGVLAVGPMTSEAIRNQLARDIIRIGQGRTDDLSELAITFSQKLAAASIPLSVCHRIRIHTLHLLEQDSASAQAALAHLEHITTQPEAAWQHLRVKGLDLIKLRGRQDAVSLAGIIPGLRTGPLNTLAPALLSNQLLDWTLNATDSFEIPAVNTLFSLDDDWIKLEALVRDKPQNLGNLEDALACYHEGGTRNKRHGQEKLSAECLGYFVRHCVVVAGPGMGKTLLLRRISRLLARKRALSLVVRLRSVAARMQAGEAFLEAVLNVGLDTSPLSPANVRALGIDNLSLLLDGMDEVGAEQEEIAKAAIALAAAYPRCRIVFTTRPIGYETSLLNRWRHYELIPIESSDAKRRVERLVNAACEPGNTKVKEATEAATSHMDYTGDYQFSARSPLLIALLASLALNEVAAASTREGLYQQLFSLIERISKLKGGKTSVAPAVLNAFLQRLGWALTDAPFADVGRVLDECARHFVVELGERLLTARAICDEALGFWEKSGFVERVRFKTTEALTFVHKTFGEFAAAQYVLLRGAEEQPALLEQIEPDPRWNEVAAFIAALGLGQELVHLALSKAGRDGSELSRSLRWAKHSKEVLPADLAEKIIQSAWPVITGPHSAAALKTGLELILASEKLPGLERYGKACCAHPQWWTALVGWTCFVRSNPAKLEFPAVLAFVESYAQDADTRSLSGGFHIGSPDRELWNLLFLACAGEVVRRGVGPNEQIFIDHLERTLDKQSIGFIRKLTAILKQAEIEIKIPGDGKSWKSYFNPEFFEKSKQDMLVLLEAIAGEMPIKTEDVKPPLLHLSAFWHGTGMMEMAISDVVPAAEAAGASEVRQVITLAARLGSYDYGQLSAEVHTKIRSLKSGDALIGSFDGLLSVDAPVIYRDTPDSSAREVIIKALLSPSEWIVQLAANLAEQLLTAADIATLVPRVLSESEGIGMAAAAYLATQFLGEDYVREQLVLRLRSPLNTGCQFLFKYLADVWAPELDGQAGEILKPALVFGPRTAKAALQLARVCSEPYRKELSPLLIEAYNYWLQNEEPYPTAGGVIPESPRGEILAQMIADGSASHGHLFEAVKDPHSDVSGPATTALLDVLSASEGARNEFVRRLHSGEKMDKLLAASLREYIKFGEQNVQRIAELLGSELPQTRYAAVGVLDPHYLPQDEIKKWAMRLISDPYQHLRDKGYEHLSSDVPNSTGFIEQIRRA